jgi:hypothetical protein
LCGFLRPSVDGFDGVVDFGLASYDEGVSGVVNVVFAWFDEVANVFDLPVEFPFEFVWVVVDWVG